jgi:hypothetical protein
MGLARLLAKGWILVCLYAGAHALRFALQSGGDLLISVPQVIVSVLLFVAMGLLFVGGYGASGANIRFHNLSLQHLKWSWPGFNDIVFLVFVVLSYVNQVVYAPVHVSGKVTDWLEDALYFAVPGHALMTAGLHSCALDGGRVFASAFAWFLAIIFAGSAISRLKLTAGLIRLERTAHPESLSPTAVAAVLGIVAVIGIQAIFVGSALTFLPCSAFASVPGALLIGLSPLLLSYVIFAALATLLASGSEK